MAVFEVMLTAYFSESIEIEADTEQEAVDYATKDFEATWVPLSQAGGFTVVWNGIEVDGVEELS